MLEETLSYLLGGGGAVTIHNLLMSVLANKTNTVHYKICKPLKP